MNLVPAAIARGVARGSLQASKNSPTILFGVGVVGMIGSTVLACRATLKVEKMIDETREDLEMVKRSNPEKFSDGDRKMATTHVVMKGAFKVAKLYGPAVLLGGASIFCLTKSHSILQARNAALTAAYVAVDEAFKKYRARVVDKYGIEEDLHLMHESEPVEILSEKGNITHSTRVADHDPSMYARFFDQLSPEWSRDPEYNFVYLKSQQSYFNHMLRAKGHVFLNEVYDALGIERTKEGAVVGWIMSKDGHTDNHVDFGLYEDNPSARNFVNGREGSVLLDFNVDGVIYDKINGHTEKTKWQS